MKWSNIFLIISSLIIFLLGVWLQRTRGELLRKKPQEFSFVVVGHVYPQWEALKSVLKQAEKTEASFIILTGDLINGEPIEEEWQDFERIMAESGIPFYIAPGNHEVDSEEKRRIFEERFGETFQSFIFQNSKFILLNSSDRTREYHKDIDQEQWEFLRREYQDPGNYEHIFLFLHHPLWMKDFSLTNASYPDNRWEQEIHPLIREKTKYVFAGDSTTFFYTEQEGVFYLVNGFGRQQRETIPYFLEVQVKGREVNIEVKTALSEAQNEIYLLKAREQK